MSNLRMERLKADLSELEYIVSEVLDQGDNSNMIKSLKFHGINNTVQLLAMDNKFLDALTFKNAQNNFVSLGIFSRQKLRFFRKFYDYSYHNGRLFDDIGSFYSMTYEEYHDFLTGIRENSVVYPTAPLPLRPSLPNKSKTIDNTLDNLNAEKPPVLLNSPTATALDLKSIPYKILDTKIRFPRQNYKWKRNQSIVTHAEFTL